MKRLCIPKHQEPPKEKLEEKKDPSLKEIEGFSSWLLYKLSKHISMGLYPINTKLCTGKKIKAKNILNLSKLKGEIGVLDLYQVSRTKGNLGTCSIKSIRVRNSYITKEIWDIVSKCRIVWLENAEISRYSEEYFRNAESIDILGTTAEQVKHCITDILHMRRRRIRVNNENILVFWDEYRGCTFASKYSDVLGVMRNIPVIKVLILDSIEVTVYIIRELSRHPVHTVKLIRCLILPLKIYDLVDVCKSSLKTVHFIGTFVTPQTVDHLKDNGIEVIITKYDQIQSNRG